MVATGLRSPGDLSASSYHRSRGALRRGVSGCETIVPNAWLLFAIHEHVFVYLWYNSVRKWYLQTIYWPFIAIWLSNAFIAHGALLAPLLPFTPHTFRHSFATHMVERGADILSLKELLGHSSVATTQVYTNVSLAHLRKTFKLTHPRAALTQNEVAGATTEYKA